MKGMLLEMGRKRLDSKMERRDRRAARRKGQQQGDPEWRGDHERTGIDMMKQKHTAGNWKVGVDTRTCKMTALLGVGRARRMHMV